MKLELLIKELNKTEGITEDNKTELYRNFYEVEQKDGEFFIHAKTNEENGIFENENKIKIILNKKNEVEKIEVILEKNNKYELSFFNYIEEINKTSFEKSEFKNLFRDIDFLNLFMSWHYSREKSLLSKFKQKYKIKEEVEDYNYYLSQIDLIKRYIISTEERLEIYKDSSEKQEILLTEIKEYNEKIELAESLLKELKETEWFKIILIEYKRHNHLWFLKSL